MAFDVGGPKGRITPQMNVTPLVDVVLVLLIIFMVVTPLLTKKFWLNVPKKDEQAETPPPQDDHKQLVLLLQKNGTIKVNAEDIPKAQLGDKLRRALAARTDGLLFFDAENDAPYGEAMELMDIARGSGAVTIAVVTKELSQ